MAPAVSGIGASTCCPSEPSDLRAASRQSHERNDPFGESSMDLNQLAQLAGIVGSVGIVLSMVFVGLQIRQQTAALNRNEHNSTMEQWTVIRMAIAKHRDIAELMTTGVQGQRVLDASEQLRLDMLLNEHLWAAFHIWDREQRGIFPHGGIRADGRATGAAAARDTRRRNVVATQQECRVPAAVCGGYRRTARAARAGSRANRARRSPLTGPSRPGRPMSSPLSQTSLAFLPGTLTMNL